MVTRVTRIKTDRKKTIFSYLLSLLPVFSVTKLQAAQTYHCCEGKSCFICVELKAGEDVMLTKVRTFKFCLFHTGRYLMLNLSFFRLVTGSQSSVHTHLNYLVILSPPFIPSASASVTVRNFVP